MLVDGCLSIIIVVVGVYWFIIFVREDWFIVFWIGFYKKIGWDLLFDIFVFLLGCLEDVIRIEVVLEMNLNYFYFYVIFVRIVSSVGI